MLDNRNPGFPSSCVSHKLRTQNQIREFIKDCVCDNQVHLFIAREKFLRCGGMYCRVEITPEIFSIFNANTES